MGQHWYKADGETLYRLIGSNGKERDTTLRDAKKLGLVPSATGINKIVAKEQVEKWKRDIMLDVIVKHGKLPEDDLLREQWNKEILLLAREEWDKASKRGTELHEKLDNYFSGSKLCEEDAQYLQPTIDFLAERFPDIKFISEESFAHSSGYGGKVDLHSKQGQGIVIDFKTKSKDKLDKSLVYDDYCQQLASYRIGLGIPEATCYNIIISTTVGQPPYLHEWSEEEVRKGYRKFQHLLAYWKEINNYDSSFSLDSVKELTK